MRFEGKIYARNWSTYLGLPLCGSLAIAFCVAFWPIGVLLALVTCRGIWLVATNKIWRVEVDDDFVSWDSMWPFGSKKSVPISRVAELLVNLDEKTYVQMRLKGLPTVRIPLNLQIDVEDFVAAIVSRSPDVLVTRKHWGST
jgi:hypothetical protein